MIGLAVLATFVALAVTTVNRLWIALAATVAVLVLVPQIASQTIGIPVVGGLNIGTVLLVLIGLVQFTVRARVYLGDVLASLPTSLAFAALIGATALTSAATGTTGAQQFLVDSILPSVIGFTLVRRALADDPRSAVWLTRAFLSAVSLQCVLALSVLSGIIGQPFEAQYIDRYYWFGPDFARALGTADSPLNLGVVVLIAICLLTGVRNGWLVAAGAALFVVTIFATESRTALVLAIVALVTILVSRRVPFLPFAAIGVVTAVLTVLLTVTAPELTDGLLDKIADDNGSADARRVGLVEGAPALVQHLVLGGGPSTAVTTASRLGLGTSFENPFLMIGLNWGVVAACCYFGIQLCTVLAPSKRARQVAGGRLAGVLSLASVLTFSSVAFVSGLGTLVWITMALAARPLSEPARTTGVVSAAS